MPKAAPVPTPIARLVESADEARAAVLAFAPALAAAPDLAHRLAFHRAWLAVKTPDGWAYAPSRFAGHVGLDGPTYLARGDELDGRRSDRTLAAWFGQVDDPRRHEKHLRRLRDLFARTGAGHAPNARVRFLEPLAEAPKGKDEAKVVELLEAVYRGLSPSGQAAFRKRIA